MLEKFKYILLVILVITLASCESKSKKLEGKWIGKSLSSPILEKNIKSFPKSVADVVRKQQDSTIQLKVDSMYVEFEIKNYEGTKGILYTNVYTTKEVVLWQYLEEESQIRLYEPDKKDRYWNVLEFIDESLIVEMNDGENNWKMSFVRDKTINKDLKLTQK
ncbi:hypothetical protein Fleli_1184 [Bernardetia litoralis DSM 6794]|uniref:Lipocalin-like domain-containing protein n=1 Tax=Bernardetia litoralis (strain ATCC 23117 / DSM 6794 / NBRC 15988 / NCIMB 1366 / Fx l1 / Sio-4) TaxID=880071 RepID=I4AI37_BERLS|nr:hypothetical protein [Bernardetia litoralis]AFM03622.1 hypothetical protein Fleli_1184 [Bernardetia litoralis DSM 6794]